MFHNQSELQKNISIKCLNIPSKYDIYATCKTSVCISAYINTATPAVISFSRFQSKNPVANTIVTQHKQEYLSDPDGKINELPASTQSQW